MNAEKKDEQIITKDLNWTDNKLYLGKPHSNDYYFYGTIKSVRIYNRALTQEEIENNYKVDQLRYGIE